MQIQTHPRPTFSLSSDHCELLLNLEATGSLGALARMMGRDVSVLSRQLQKLSQLLPVLEKNQGRWRLTALGKQMSHWARDAAETQRRLLRQRTVLRVASTREFAARVIAGSFLGVVDSFGSGEGRSTELSVVTSEDGVERLLLSGEADFGFDCGRPEDPLIKFRTGQAERFVMVASPAFLRAHGKLKARVTSAQAEAFLSELTSLPHLRCQRISASQLLQLPRDLAHVRASFNDIAGARESCCHGHGWTILPQYAVQRELDAGLLREIALPAGREMRSEQYGVWWLRSRKAMLPWVETAWKWLEVQRL